MLTREGGNPVELSQDKIMAVEELANTKYRTWNWIYGWSPDYELHNAFKSGDLECLIFIKVHRGFLKDCLLESNQIPHSDLRALANLLLDCPHDAEPIRTVINAWNHPALRQEIVIEELVNSFF
jgi:lipoate-protein ligase A